MMQLFFGGIAAHADQTAGNLPTGESPFAYSDPQRCQQDLETAGFQNIEAHADHIEQLLAFADSLNE